MPKVPQNTSMRRQCCYFSAKYQSSTNLVENPKIRNAIDFLKDIVPDEVSRVLKEFKSLNKNFSLNYRMIDRKIADLIYPLQEEWEKELQEFCSTPREKIRVLLLQNPRLLHRMKKLSSYLEKGDIKKLREKFPSLAYENLQMALRQERGIERCTQMIEMQQNLKNSTTLISIPNSLIIPDKMEENSNECQCCCEDKILVVCPVCKHKYCCTDCASKLKKCPLCRASLSTPIISNEDESMTIHDNDCTNLNVVYEGSSSISTI
jgi:hypothetical protein